MSLVNTMLRDLEQRRETLDELSADADLTPAPEPLPLLGPQRLLPMIALCLLLLLSILAYAYSELVAAEATAAAEDRVSIEQPHLLFSLDQKETFPPVAASSFSTSPP